MTITAREQRERRRVWLFALLVITLTTLPYLLAALRAGENWVYSGFLFGADDGYSYLGKMRLGARGLLDFYLFYTPEPHASAPLIFLPYILPGWLVGRFINDRDPALTGALTLVYHLMRIAFDLLLIQVLYRFIAVFLRAPHARFTALLLATLGGGFGWLLALIGQSDWLGTLPPEFYIPEAFGFLILFGLPHLALARAALLLGLLSLLRAVSPQVGTRRAASLQSTAASPHPSFLIPRTFSLSTQYSVLSTLYWLLVLLVVPFYGAVLYLLLGVWGVVAWIAARRFPRRLALVGIPAAVLTLPLFGYFAWVFSSNPMFAAWSAQNLLPSPHPLQYVQAYLPLLIPALVAARWVWRRARQDMRYALLIGWPLIVPLLVYLPVNVRRRMAEAVIVPLAILAAAGLDFIARSKGWRRLRRPLAAVALGSSAFLLFGGTLAALNPALPLFHPAADVAALNWLNNEAAPDSVVLAAFETGNVLPAYTNLRPYVGHGPETVGALEKTAVTERFFGGQMTPDERQTFYASVNIQYIFYGPLERALAPDPAAPPAWADGLTLLYDADGYQIYAVP